MRTMLIQLKSSYTIMQKHYNFLFIATTNTLLLKCNQYFWLLIQIQVTFHSDMSAEYILFSRYIEIVYIILVAITKPVTHEVPYNKLLNACKF